MISKDLVEHLENGNLFMNQAVNLAAAAGLWGTLVGLLLLNPLAGLAVRALTGAGIGPANVPLVVR